MSFEQQTGRDKFFALAAQELEALIDPRTSKVREELVQAIPCPLCDSTDYDPLFTKQGFDFVRCQHCTLIYVNPQLKLSEVEQYYKNEGPSSASEWRAVMLNPVDKAWRTTYFNEALDRIQKIVPSGKLLDVGCSIGLFMEQAQERGFDCIGLEPEPAAYEYAVQERNLNVRRETLREAAFADESFDVVTLFGVLEHLSNPRAMLDDINRILKPGGAIAIVVPNVYSLAAMVMHATTRTFTGRNHLSYFSQKTLTAILQRTGFHVESLDTTVTALDSIINYFQFLDPFTKVSTELLPEKLRHLAENEREQLEKLMLDLDLGYRLRVVARKVSA